MTYEDNLKSALKDAVVREQTAQRRSLVYTLIPVVMTVMLIVVSWQQVSTARKELNVTNQQLTTAASDLSQTRSEFDAVQTELKLAQQDIITLQQQSEQYQRNIEKLSADVKNYQQEIEQLRTERDELKKAIDELGAQVQQSQGLKRYINDVNLMLVLKSMPSDRRADLLYEIWAAQVESQSMWHPGGIGPDEFDSPGYAVYLLNKVGIVKENPEDIHYSLISMLPPKRTAPENGDIVFYEGGYTMFFFYDEDGQPFVIGMTPLGIVALQNDFAPIRMIAEVEYPAE